VSRSFRQPGSPFRHVPGALAAACLALWFLVPSLGARNYAGDVFAHDIWKLVIPLDDNHDEDPHADEVTMPTLRRFEDPDFFRLSRQEDSILFRARCGDPTPENEEFARCELREMTKGGEHEAKWSTTDGRKHTLAIELAVRSVPAKTPSVVCLQAHDDDGPWLSLRLDGKRLRLTQRNEDDIVLDDDYALGDFTYLILLFEKGEFKLLHENELIAVREARFEDSFFTAGCLLQSNTATGEKADSFGEVEIKRLYVTRK